MIIIIYLGNLKPFPLAKSLRHFFAKSLAIALFSFPLVALGATALKQLGGDPGGVLGLEEEWGREALLANVQDTVLGGLYLEIGNLF